LRSFVLGNPQVFKSVILFCTHALEMHDSRACAMITRVLRTLVPEFAKDEPIAGEIREFMCTEVFRACITSLHDPYFVDAQNDLANLIASIVTRYSTFTSTPQQLLASLPGMTEDKVQRASYKLFRASTHGRQQRAIVLKLLEDLRGTSIHEQGKIPQPDPKKVRSAMQEKYMTLEPKRETNRDPSPDLGGVADMFA
jgi:exportin-5